ncbi:putative bifunctional diguanylate cyclase/phosphodiesterase [Vallitalea okinawensis]|uniref:putative bifunctional diguanylate cyclase/phosphodiesterase n=1 Tax=Vallitalea okinawensis TaxID=2078660 RepID=UPI000CFCC71F|nr:EAL domain-containing protein [Vallitalea okinawensis]
MRKKLLIKSVRFIIFISFIYVLIVIALLLSSIEVNLLDFILEGLFTCLSIGCLIVSLELKNKPFSFGWLFLSISLLTDTLDEIDAWQPYEWLEFILEKLLFGVGFVLVIYGLYLSLTRRNVILNKLEYMINNDPLTGLPNKSLLVKRFEEMVQNDSKNNEQVGIMFIDLDKFKLVNNTFGHAVGDDLLKQVADRLRVIVGEKDSLARLSGDEFILILSNLQFRRAIKEIAKDVLNIFSEPFMLNGKYIHISCSIGVTLFPEHGMDMETLFSNADMAVHKAKVNGGNQYTIFNEEMHRQCQRKLLIKENLQQALKGREFILHYQPKVDILTGEITGLEALVRWQRPNGKLSYPNEFIQIAEETGIIKEIDFMVLELACMQIKKWMNQGIKPLNIAVNISAKLFSTLDFLEKVEDILETAAIDASYLSIEITETEGIEDIQYVRSILEALKKKNIKIALDDYGTGYSSLNYLKILPIDSLKIDRIFVDGITKDEKDKSLLNAAVMMTKILEIRVICEGVETSEQLNILKSIGCNEYQGYYYSKPVPIELIEENLIL